MSLSTPDIRRMLVDLIIKNQICQSKSVLWLADFLQKNGSMSLDFIQEEFKSMKKSDTSIQDSDLTNSLAVLIKHDLVNAFGHQNMEYKYKFDSDKCLLRLSLPRFLSQLHQLYDSKDTQQVILETIKVVLQHGSIIKIELIKTLRAKQFLDSLINKAIDQLIEQTYLIGASKVEVEEESKTQIVSTDNVIANEG